mmetsp:Transcript_17573/g.36396  ORF Transcript_17573/g.36396 Transcript_17573/m.36396 type:complete len:315 (+) Transcript_17573:1578-2522(+)
MRYLEQALPSFMFANESSCDELHKNGKVGTEPFALFPKERRFRNAPRVHTAERDAGQLVVLGMQEVGHHHEAKFGILVRLGPNEAVSIRHGNRILKPSLQSIELVEIGNGINTSTSNSVVISSDTTHHNDTWIRRVQHGLHEQTNHQEMREVVDLHRLFMVVSTPLGVVQGRLVDTSIANETINGFVDAEFFHFLAKFANGFKRIEFTLNGGEAGHVKAIHFGDGFHLVQISNSTHNMIFSRLQQSQGCFTSKTRGSSSQNHKFLISKLILDFFFIRIMSGHLPLGHELEGIQARERPKPEAKDHGYSFSGHHC